MFEQSLVESRVPSMSQSRRWTAFASISLQVAVAAIVFALPLLHPEALPFHLDPPKLLLPLPPKPPMPVVRVEQASRTSTSVALPTMARAIIKSMLPKETSSTSDAPSLQPIGIIMDAKGSFPNAAFVGGGTPGPHISVASPQPAPWPLSISSGVSQGMLIAPIRPVYPAIARSAHVAGAVIVEAVISRTGTIERLHVISGPVMLQNAALEAIRAARYLPYRLNGQPTEVQTTITVNFRMSSD